MSLKLKIVILLVATVKETCFGWGFYAHKQINRQAVFSLPNNTLFSFFKTNIDYLTENAVNPDKRRYTTEEEACRHYIDLDSYNPSNFPGNTLPKYWGQAEKAIQIDTLKKHGILPWHIYKVQGLLTKAMIRKDGAEILRLASDLGHYVGDANVPLHTTHNYDGQYTNQKGIHALWETRVPELFLSDYDFLVGKAVYISDVQEYAWKTVRASHAAVDSVFKTESLLTSTLSPDLKYAFEDRNGVTIRLYSSTFSEKYSEMLDGQVERQLQRSIKMVADLWYTSWIEAGQPDLSSLSIPSKEAEKQEDQKIKSERFLESHNCDEHHQINSENLLTKTNY